MGRFGGKYRILSCSLRGGTPGPQNFAMTFLTQIHTSCDISLLGVDNFDIFGVSDEFSKENYKNWKALSLPFRG